MSADAKSFESQYPKLERPNFTSSIPAHLLGKLTDAERFYIETLSKTEQQNEFLINAALENNRVNRDIDRRMQKQESIIDERLKIVEGWQKMVTNKWSVVLAFILWISPLVAKIAWDKFNANKPIPQAINQKQ